MRSSTCGQMERALLAALESRTGVVPAQLAEVGDRDDDAQVPLLGAAGVDDLDGMRAAEEAGDLVDRPDRRREADPLGRLSKQGVKSFEREREVGPALRAGNGVDLVDDDGFDAAEGLPGLGRQDKEQRLRGGDEHVGWRALRTVAARRPVCRRTGCRQ